MFVCFMPQIIFLIRDCLLYSISSFYRQPISHSAKRASGCSRELARDRCLLKTTQEFGPSWLIPLLFHSSTWRQEFPRWWVPPLSDWANVQSYSGMKMEYRNILFARYCGIAKASGYVASWWRHIHPLST